MNKNDFLKNAEEFLNQGRICRECGARADRHFTSEAIWELYHAGRLAQAYRLFQKLLEMRVADGVDQSDDGGSQFKELRSLIEQIKGTMA